MNIDTIIKNETQIDSGIHIISQATKNYVDVDDVDTMLNPLLEDITQGLDWKKAVKKYIYPQNRFLYQIIMSQNRADYLDMVDLTEDSVALDVGAGWGQSTFKLAKKCKHVFALDGTKQRVEFIHKVAEQEKLKNVIPIVSDFNTLKLAPSSLDLVTLIGVLEWLPKYAEGNPKEIQISALKKIYNSLKKDSILVIAIENSHGRKYFHGAPDDHTGLQNITYLPRDEADQLSLQQLNEPYRTYTYTQEGYTKLLSKAGFSPKKVKYYYPVTNYKNYSYLVDLDHVKTQLEFLYSNLYKPTDSIEKKVVDDELNLIKKGKSEELKNSVSSYFIFAQK